MADPTKIKFEQNCLKSGIIEPQIRNVSVKIKDKDAKNELNLNKTFDCGPVSLRNDLQEAIDNSQKEFFKNRKVIIKNVPPVTYNEVKCFMGNYAVANIAISKKARHAIVNLLHGEEAEEVEKVLDGQKLLGMEVSVSLYPHERLLCVAHLPSNMSDSEFRTTMLEYGSIERCFIMRSSITGLPKGYGFVEFTHNKEHTERVQQILDDKRYGSCITSCNFLKERVLTYKDLHSKCLLVDHLPPGYNNFSRLKNLMNQFAQPIYTQCAVKNGVPLGFAVFEYKTPEEAEQTQRHNNGYTIIGQNKIRVTFCIPGYGAPELHNMKMVKATGQKVKQGLLPRPVSGVNPMFLSNPINPIIQAAMAQNPTLMPNFQTVLQQLQSINQTAGVQHGLIGVGGSDPMYLQLVALLMAAQMQQPNQNMIGNCNDPQILQKILSLQQSLSQHNQHNVNQANIGAKPSLLGTPAMGQLSSMIQSLISQIQSTHRQSAGPVDDNGNTSENHYQKPKKPCLLPNPDQAPSVNVPLNLLNQNKNNHILNSITSLLAQMQRGGMKHSQMQENDSMRGPQNNGGQRPHYTSGSRTHPNPNQSRYSSDPKPGPGKKMGLLGNAPSDGIQVPLLPLPVTKSVSGPEREQTSKLASLENTKPALLPTPVESKTEPEEKGPKKLLFTEYPPKSTPNLQTPTKVPKEGLNPGLNPLFAAFLQGPLVPTNPNQGEFEIEVSNIASKKKKSKVPLLPIPQSALVDIPMTKLMTKKKKRKGLLGDMPRRNMMTRAQRKARQAKENAQIQQAEEILHAQQQVDQNERNNNPEHEDLVDTPTRTIQQQLDAYLANTPKRPMNDGPPGFLPLPSGPPLQENVYPSMPPVFDINPESAGHVIPLLPTPNIDPQPSGTVNPVYNNYNQMQNYYNQMYQQMTAIQPSGFPPQVMPDPSQVDQMTMQQIMQQAILDLKAPDRSEDKESSGPDTDTESQAISTDTTSDTASLGDEQKPYIEPSDYKEFYGATTPRFQFEDSPPHVSNSRKRTSSEAFFIPPAEPSPEGDYIGQHSQGLGGHYAESYFKRRKLLE
ncbi:unnamed protein product [Owenia fusiformis]|uniref:RRM domain-containing protein n=1 Tax=Owenia fusiformis TaxID=6347 RepID=A0A8S4N2W5_OWEFU|nr:unnamed protein product [Owenia fusiformis]